MVTDGITLDWLAGGVFLHCMAPNSAALDTIAPGRISPCRISPITTGGVIIGRVRVSKAAEIDRIHGPVNIAVAGLNDHCCGLDVDHGRGCLRLMIADMNLIR